MVSSFPQAGPCICEVAPRWLRSCHLYYGSTSIRAALRPQPCSVASTGSLPGLNMLRLQALLIRFVCSAKIVQEFYCFPTLSNSQEKMGI